MINKTYIPFILFIFLYSTLTNAQINLLKAENYILKGNINLIEDQLTSVESLSGASISLINGELEISFPLQQTKEEQFYDIRMEVELNGLPMDLEIENIKGFYGTKITNLTTGIPTITWMNLIETYYQLEGQLEIKVSTELRGKLEVPIDCNTPPTFNQKQKLPYLAAGGVGLVSIGLGQLFKRKSQSTYDDEYLASLTLEEAQPRYDDANRDHHTYLILTYAGSAIIVTDLVLYLIKNKKYRDQLKLYKKFCNGNSLSIQPLIELPSMDTSLSGTSGVRFTLNF